MQKGIPTVGFGPLCGGLTMSGHADKWVDIDSFVRAIAAAAEMIMAWCDKENPDGAIIASELDHG